MAFKDLSEAEKLSLLDNLTWDYSVTSEDLLSITEKKTDQNTAVYRKDTFCTLFRNIYLGRFNKSFGV